MQLIAKVFLLGGQPCDFRFGCLDFLGSGAREEKFEVVLALLEFSGAQSVGLADEGALHEARGEGRTVVDRRLLLLAQRGIEVLLRNQLSREQNLAELFLLVTHSSFSVRARSPSDKFERKLAAKGAKRCASMAALAPWTSSP